MMFSPPSRPAMVVLFLHGSFAERQQRLCEHAADCRSHRSVEQEEKHDCMSACTSLCSPLPKSSLKDNVFAHVNGQTLRRSHHKKEISSPLPTTWLLSLHPRRRPSTLKSTRRRRRRSSRHARTPSSSRSSAPWTRATMTMARCVRPQRIRSRRRVLFFPLEVYNAARKPGRDAVVVFAIVHMKVYDKATCLLFPSCFCCRMIAGNL